jgi:hypothetical protein
MEVAKADAVERAEGSSPVCIERKAHKWVIAILDKLTESAEGIPLLGRTGIFDQVIFDLRKGK